MYPSHCSTSFLPFFPFLLAIDGPPAVAVNAVDATGPIGSRCHIVQVGPSVRPINLGAGVKGTLLQLLATKAGGGGGGQVHICLIRLINLGLVREEDLWLRAGGVEERKGENSTKYGNTEYW